MSNKSSTPRADFFLESLRLIEKLPRSKRALRAELSAEAWRILRA